MAVARHDLGGGALGRQAQPVEHPGLVVGIVRRVGPHRARDRSDRHLGEGALEPLRVAVCLEREAGELEPERRRLRVHPMGAPDLEGAGVLACTVGQRAHELARRRHDHLARRLQLER